MTLPTKEQAEEALRAAAIHQTRAISANADPKAALAASAGAAAVLALDLPTLLALAEIGKRVAYGGEEVVERVASVYYAQCKVSGAPALVARAVLSALAGKE